MNCPFNRFVAVLRQVVFSIAADGPSVILPVSCNDTEPDRDKHRRVEVCVR